MRTNHWTVQLGARLAILGAGLVYPALGSAQPGKAVDTYKQGWIAFTQGGKSDSLPLQSGSMDEPAPPIGQPGDRNVDLAFSGQNGASFEVSIGKSGGQSPVVHLKLNGGPAGSSDGPDMMSTPCQSKFTKFDGTGIEATVTCTGQFNSGPPITSVRLSVKP
jgi:hypothetical protein